MTDAQAPRPGSWKFPQIRALAPLRLLVQRALHGDYWAEFADESATRSPRISLSNIDDVQHPRDGAGPLMYRTYRVQISGSALTPEELLVAFVRHPNRFSPTSYATFATEQDTKGLEVGSRAEVLLPGPWDGPVLVAAVEPRRLRFETLDGHMEAGWIEFATSRKGDLLEFEIESLASAGDRLFDALYRRARIAKLLQSEMWAQVLEAAVRESGGAQVGRLTFRTTRYPRRVE